LASAFKTRACCRNTSSDRSGTFERGTTRVFGGLAKWSRTVSRRAASTLRALLPESAAA
jgi:transposase